MLTYSYVYIVHSKQSVLYNSFNKSKMSKQSLALLQQNIDAVETVVLTG